MFGYGTAAKFLRFGFLIYYILTISFRVLFLENFNIYTGHGIALMFDYLADFFYLMDVIISNPDEEAAPTPKTNQQILSSTIHRQTLVVSRNANVPQLRIPVGRKTISDNPLYEKAKLIIPQFIMIFPFEFIGMLASMPGFYALRAIRLIRCAYFYKYWVDIGDFLQKTKIATTAGARRVIIFLVVMIVTSHVMACVFYAVAIGDLKRDIPANWLVVDNLVVLDTTTGSFEFLENVSYRYLRAMYWAVQTITTVGFGDIAAHSESETWFCIGFFFLIALLVNFTLANLTLAISRFDEAYTQNLMKISRFEKYAAYRRLPPALTARVVSYYEHQWKKLRGVDELQIYSELPTRLSNQVMHQVIRDKLLQIRVLNTLNKSCLNALTRRVESYVFSPQDSIVQEHGQVTGVFIISEGIILRRSSRNKHAPMEMFEGHTFGEGALLENYVARHTYTAKTYSEILFLPGSTFRHLCQMYLAANEVDNVIQTLTDLTKEMSVARTSNPGSPFKKVHRLSIFGKTSLIRVDAAVSKPKVVDGMLKSFLHKAFHPDSKFRILWDCLIFCGILFYSISCGLLLQAMLRQDFIVHYSPLLLASYIVDLIFLVDGTFCAFFFGYDQDGIIVTDMHKIFLHFWKSHHPLALLCVVLPFDLVFGLLINIKLLPLLRVVKVLHLCRFNVYWANVEYTLLQCAGVAMSFEVSRFLNLYIILFVLCHWCGCIWTLTAEVSMKIFGYRTSWRYAETHTSFYHYNYERLGGTMPYWRELYWPVNVLSGISWSDQLPRNPVEVISVSCIMMFGLLLFCTLIGALSTLMERFNKIRRDFDTKVDKIRLLVKQKSVSKEIEGKINRYYEYIWARYGGVDEAEVLGNLPKSLRAAVANHVLGPLLKKIPFFDCCSEPMEQMIVSLFETRIFLQDDALMLFGEVGQDMFIIEHGEVEITSADRSVTYARLKDGDYVGESCFLDITKRTASAFAVDYVDTYFLTKDNFLKAAEKFPAEYRTILEAIRHTLEQKTSKNVSLAVAPKRSSTIVEKENKLRLQRSLLKANQDLAAKLAASLGIIHPESNTKMMWDLAIGFTLLYYAIIIPLRIAINRNSNLLWLDFVFDAVNLIDNCLCMRVFAVYVAGELLVDPNDIQRHYLKTRFATDLLATIPYDLIALAYTDKGPGELHIIQGLLRLPKLVRLCMASQYVDQVKRLLYKVHASTALIQIIHLTSAILMIMHWVGCVFYMLAEFGGPLGTCVNSPGAYYGTACRFRNTWVGQQISINLLPADGGTQWIRFLKALYWALGTCVAVTLGEILIMSDIEVVFAFLVTFFGLCINGMILGSIMTLVTESSEDSSRIFRDMEVLQSYLVANKVPQELINRATAQLRHLSTTEGYLTVNQTAIFAELPHSIKLAIDNQVKTIPFLRRCPIFDFCSDEILRGISAKLQVQFNVKGDKIIVGGELGHEMYFVESGAVNVVSLDGLIVYSTLEEGAFFGETAIFFHTVRSATVVVASPFCVCLRLAKADLEHELRSADFDPAQVIKPFTELQSANERRNKAVTANLALAKEPTSKLHRLVGLSVESRRQSSYLHRLRAYMTPTCAFRVVWDCLGTLLLMYYAVSIVFYIAFFFGPKITLYWNFIAFDFLIDFYWVVDVVLKAFVFGFKADIMHDKIVTDSDAIWKHYKDTGYFELDIFASIPFELFALIPHSHPVLIFVLRLNHFLRVLQLNNYAKLVEFHLQIQLGITFSRATWQLFRICALYCAIVHWMSCGYFMIHRYAERHSETTFAVADNMATYDPVTHMHDICSHNVSYCYARSLYFVLGTVAGIGYGDIIPQTTLEILYQMITIIIDAFLAATLHGFCAIYLEEYDAKSNDVFHAKMQKLHIFIAFRKLPKVTGDAILAQYTHMWRKVKSTRAEKNEILSLLSQSSAMDLSMHLQSAVIQLAPLLRELAPQTSRRIALVLHPQIATADTYLYKAGDAGECIYFVSHGAMQAELNSDLSLLDARGIAALQILAHKHKHHGDVHKAGDHFGEFCVVSRAGLRAESIKVLSGSEVYSLNREDLWSIFQYLTYEDRRAFIYNLMTRVGGRRHITMKLAPLSASYAAQVDDTRLKVLYRIAFDIMSEIIDALDEEELNETSTEDDENRANERHNDLKMLLRQQTMKPSLFSQRDLIDLFERENTTNPTVHFSEVALRSRLNSFANPESADLGMSRRFSSFSAADRVTFQREDVLRSRASSFGIGGSPSASTLAGPGTPFCTPRTSSKRIMVSAEELELRDVDSDEESKEDEAELEDAFFLSVPPSDGAGASRKRSQSNNFVHQRVLQLSTGDAAEIELREARSVSPTAGSGKYPGATPRNTAITTPLNTNKKNNADRKGSGVRFDLEAEVVEFESPPSGSHKALRKSSSRGKEVELKHRSSDVDYNVVRNALEIEQVLGGSGNGRRRGSTSIDLKDRDISELYKHNI